jgi:hypothetical protein
MPRSACVRRWRALVGAAILFCIFVPPHASADPRPAPPEFNRVLCYQMVQQEGRLIARARWEQGASLDKTRAAKLGAGGPPWIADLVQSWIRDAYAWQVTDEQVRQWAEELGDASNLPSASRLTVHQTIAIWMRRISRQCDGPRAQAGARRAVVATVSRALPPF